MFEEMFIIARNKLTTINEIFDGIPAPQVTVLFTENKHFYVAVNDVDGLICDELKSRKDTKVVRILTMWKNGQLDLSSLKFRKALIELDQYNYNTDIILQEKDGFNIKKLCVPMP